MHALQAGRRADVADGVTDDQIARLDQLDAHLAREESVLEVGRVRRTRGPHDDRRLALGRGRDGAQRAEQQLRVVVNAAYAI